MKIYVKEYVYSTGKEYELIDITGDVESAVAKSKVQNGICLVFAPHATAAIIANEHEKGLIEDIISAIKEHFPRSKNWRHNLIDTNAAAHVASSFIGADKVFPVINGRLVRGTWQNIFLVELDGPRRRRRVIVEVIGD